MKKLIKLWEVFCGLVMPKAMAAKAVLLPQKLKVVDEHAKNENLGIGC